MTFRQYRDFILVADDVHVSDGKVEQFTVSVFDSPVGQGEQKEQVRVPDKLDQSLRWLEQRRLKDLKSQIELGEKIGLMLLPPYARRLFDESLRHIGEREGLRLRLRLDDRLADIPWEYAFVSRTRGEKTADGFLALDPHISIVRHEALAVPGDWFGAASRRRVLVAMASPKPYDKYRKLEFLPREQHEIHKALSKIAGVEAVFVPLYPDGVAGDTPGVTVGQLSEALTKWTDVFHFSGHGEFVRDLATEGGEGGLVFANVNDEAFPVSSTKLAEMLKSRGVRLVVLGACEGGRRDGQNVWSGVAAALLRIGTPAVVAMQYTIADNLAAAFSAAFYGALVAGYTIDEAVAAGRAAIRVATDGSDPDSRDWGVPVLYLRSPSGVVFNPVQDEAARKEAMTVTGHLVDQRVRELAATGRMTGLEADVVRPGDVVTINQKVEQEAAGAIVGGHVVRLEGGRLTVTQQADRVTGEMVGLRLGSVGGPKQPAKSQQDPAAQLEDLLRLK
jgi:CHAT domain